MFFVRPRLSRDLDGARNRDTFPPIPCDAHGPRAGFVHFSVMRFLLSQEPTPDRHLRRVSRPLSAPGAGPGPVPFSRGWPAACCGAHVRSPCLRCRGSRLGREPPQCCRPQRAVGRHVSVCPVSVTRAVTPSSPGCESPRLSQPCLGLRVSLGDSFDPAPPQHPLLSLFLSGSFAFSLSRALELLASVSVSSSAVLSSLLLSPLSIVVRSHPWFSLQNPEMCARAAKCEPAAEGLVCPPCLEGAMKLESSL